jgi:antitoxin VapB
MNTTKLRMQGNEQIAILPEGFQLVDDEVYIKKVGNAIILIPKNNPCQTLLNSLDLFSDDFMETKEQPLLLESSLSKDWLSEEENEAWKDLN